MAELEVCSAVVVPESAPRTVGQLHESFDKLVQEWDVIAAGAPSASGRNISVEVSMKIIIQ